MDVVALYVGLGTVIGTAIGGVTTAIIRIRKQQYEVSKDEFKTVIAEVKEQRDRDRQRLDLLEKKYDECEEEHRKTRVELELIRQKSGEK